MWKFLPLFLLVCSSPAKSQVLLNEVYYDHSGSDTGHEFIELINSAPTPVVLDRYELKFHDGSSSGWVTIWSGASGDSLAPSELFVIGDVLVPGTPDAVTALRLQNGPDAVGLFLDGSCVDRLGYGVLEDTLFFEGNYAPDVAEGRSLARQPDGHDSNDNARDFQSAEPSPGGRNTPRFDVTLSPAPDTPARAAWTGGTGTISVRVENRGIDRVDSGEVTVCLRDSSASGWETLAEVSAGTIDVASLWDASFSLRLADGYHFLIAEAKWSADERPLNNFSTITRRVGRSPVLISEVMSYPAPGCSEYVELTNVGVHTYIADNLTIRDAAHTPVPLSRAVELATGASIVVAEDPVNLIEWFPTLSLDAVVGVDGTWPSLNSSGSGSFTDSVIVLDRFGIVVDGVAYPPQAAGDRGKSLERIDLFAGGANTWVLSSSPGGGSPGLRYPAAISAAPRGNAVRVSPRTFDPDRGERMLITVPEQPQISRAVVRIYDVDGYEVRELGATNVLPYVFVWDGVGRANRTVTPGVYVLTCEFIEEGGVRRVEKITIGRGRAR